MLNESERKSGTTNGIFTATPTPESSRMTTDTFLSWLTKTVIREFVHSDHSIYYAAIATENCLSIMNCNICLGSLRYTLLWNEGPLNG